MIRESSTIISTAVNRHYINSARFRGAGLSVIIVMIWVEESGRGGVSVSIASERNIVYFNTETVTVGEFQFAALSEHEGIQTKIALEQMGSESSFTPFE